MKIRLFVIAVFVSAAALPGFLAIEAGLLPGSSSSGGPAGRVAGTEFQVTPLDWPDLAQGLSSTSSLVIWMRHGSSSTFQGLWAYDTASQQSYRLLGPGEAFAGVGAPSGSGTLVTWARRSKGVPRPEIRGYDSFTRRRFLVATGGQEPVASSRGIAFVRKPAAGSGAGDLVYGYDTVTGDRRRFVAGGRVHDLAAWDTWVAWIAGPGGAAPVYAANRRSPTVLKLASAGTAVAVSHDGVAWAAPSSGGRTAIMLWDRSAGAKRQLCQVDGRVLELARTDSLVVWQTATGNGDIWVYDLKRGAAFPICMNAARQADPAIVGGTVYWADNRSGSWVLYGRSVWP